MLGGLVSGITGIIDKVGTVLGGSGIIDAATDFLRGPGIRAIGETVLDDWLGFDIPREMRVGGQRSAAPQPEFGDGIPWHYSPGSTSGMPVPRYNMIRNLPRASLPVPKRNLELPTPLPSPDVGSIGGLPTEASCGGPLSTLLKIASANSGIRATTKKIVSHMRNFGFEQTAAYFGLSIPQLSYIWIRGTKRVKRRFTGRDKSRAKAYIRHLKSCESELKSLASSARGYRRRSSSRAGASASATAR